MSSVLVLGLGNPLLGDDGVGLCLLETLQQRRQWPEHVDFVDGGTWGLSLLPDICDADSLLILDAVDAGEPPGTVLRGDDDAVPRWYAGPLSPHQIDLREVLAAAEILGSVPQRLVVVGVQPAEAGELHVGLSAAVQGAVPTAAVEAERVLCAWLDEVGASPAPTGAACAPRSPSATARGCSAPWPATVGIPARPR